MLSSYSSILLHSSCHVYNFILPSTIMVPDTTARPPRPGLSLYANLLDPSSNKDSAPGTILRAPVVFKQPVGDELQQDRAAAEKQQISAGRYQPTSI